MMVLLGALAAAVSSDVSAQATAAPPSARTITPLRGNVYLARVDWRSTVVFVTPDGIIVGDPISEEGARWLRGELATRFPGERVRYVLHSHHHFDRARGASVFQGAETLGHRLFNDELHGARGSVTYGEVLPVKRTFDLRERLTLGGRTVEIVHTGPFHSADMSALYFPEERVLFDVAPPDVDLVPFRFAANASPQDVARWLAVVGDLDIDVIITSDGRSIDAAAVRSFKPYLDDLIAAVTAGVRDGRTLGQLRAEVLLPAHRSNAHYAARVAHIDGVYQTLSLRQWSVQAAAGIGRISEPAAYCPGYDPCNPPRGILPSGTIGVGYSFGRVGFVGEVDGGDQLSASRSSRFYDDVISNRRMLTSSLIRYRLGSPTGSGMDVLAGFTRVFSDTRGLDRVKEALIPVGGRHAIASQLKTFGYTVGVELVLPISPRWSLRTPVRFTSGNDEELHPGKRDIRAGLGVAYRISRHVAVKRGQPAPVVMRSTP